MKAAAAGTENLPIFNTTDSIDWSRYEFIDLGCSRGGSLEFCMKRFHASQGIGIDLSPAKVQESWAAGFEAVVADARHLSVSPPVRFVSMMDFLEHLPDLETVEHVLGSAANAATDFLFIRHPSFEGEAYIPSLGVRQYWWSWHGHTAHIHIADYCQMFERLGLHSYFIRYREPVIGSAHPSIVPVDAPRSSGPFDAAVHGAKPDVVFAEPLWRAQDIFVALRPFSPDEWKKITRVR